MIVQGYAEDTKKWIVNKSAVERRVEIVLEYAMDLHDKTDVGYVTEATNVLDVMIFHTVVLKMMLVMFVEETTAHAQIVQEYHGDQLVKTNVGSAMATMIVWIVMEL